MAEHLACSARLIIRWSMGKDKQKSDLMPGTLDMLVLKTLTRGPLHGYAIAQLIHQLSEDILQVEEGSLSRPSALGIKWLD